MFFFKEFVRPFLSRFWLLGMILILWACGGEPGRPEGRAQPRGGVEVDGPIDPSRAATLWRFIGIDDDPASPCPQLAGWTTGRLFDPGDGSAIPPRLRPFCVYETGQNQEPLALASLVAPGLLSAVETDFMGSTMMASGDQLQSLAWADLEAHFLEQMGAIPLPSSPGAKPRLAVLDTGATRDSRSEDYLGNSKHGFSMVNMAKALLCSAGTCRADVTTRLALAYESFHQNNRAISGRNEAEGGVIGTIADLGKAIRDEVHAWEIKGTNDRLVLNLSVAWDGRFGGLTETVVDMSPAVRAVYHALEDASCRGALVLAAAGNTGGGPSDESGPLLPAAWEGRRAPSLVDCQKVLGTKPDGALFPKKVESPYRPLVYSVGGVEADGTNLTNSREGSTPRQVAYGDHAVVSRFGLSSPTEIYTGTSVAAVAVSAIAAAVWDYRPDLRADQVMQTVYGAGETLGRAAETCLGASAADPCPGSGWTVRRAHLCEAVTAACASGGSQCPSSGFSACSTWPTDNGALIATDLSAFSGITIDLDDVDQAYGRPPECRGESLLFHRAAASPPKDPCPHWQYHGLPVVPWTGPQPASIPCPGCWLFYSGGGSGTLYVEITSDFEGALTDGTLKIGLNTYNLGLGSLAPGDTAVITDIPLLTTSATPVTVSFTLDGGKSVSNSVLVVGL